ncbi:hypothetical protein TWF481_000756 [Arthrobotrys musiformis]|uniref:Uncharacterized protein n=1 Tax=Arthrobotrys musiformis TaxID=47236 RepID=A0AAV9WQS8_9PEZI
MSRGEIVDEVYLREIDGSGLFSRCTRILFCVAGVDLHMLDGSDVALTHQSIQIATKWDNMNTITVYVILRPTLMWAIGMVIGITASVVTSCYERKEATAIIMATFIIGLQGLLTSANDNNKP